jgi:DNA-binding winged helix-turn-helix (wHTH) protein
MPRAIDGFAVDLMRCALLRSDAEIRLRPKAFDVLCHLAPNCR